MSWMSNGVTFLDKNSSEEFHTYNTLGMYIAGRAVIYPPEQQESYVEVPGRDGLLDLSQALDGMVHYNNRSGEMTLSIPGNKENSKAKYHDLQNRLQGRRFSKIIFDDDPCWYYVGRADVGQMKQNVAGATVPVTFNLEPYKYAVNNEYIGREEWLWDALDFEIGYIPETVSGETSKESYRIIPYPGGDDLTEKRYTDSKGYAWYAYSVNWSGDTMARCGKISIDNVAAQFPVKFSYYIAPGGSYAKTLELSTMSTVVDIPIRGNTVFWIGVPAAEASDTPHYYLTFNDFTWRSL